LNGRTWLLSQSLGNSPLPNPGKIEFWNESEFEFVGRSSLLDSCKSLIALNGSCQIAGLIWVNLLNSDQILILAPWIK